MSVNLQVRLSKTVIATLAAFVVFLLFKNSVDESFGLSLYVGAIAFLFFGNSDKSIFPFILSSVGKFSNVKNFLEKSFFRKISASLSFLWFIYGSYSYFSIVNQAQIYNDSFYWEKLNFVNFLFELGIPVYYTEIFSGRSFSLQGYLSFIFVPVALIFVIFFLLEWIFGDKSKLES